MVKASTSVGFREEGKRLVLETDSSSGLIKDPGISFVRVFPHYASPVVSAVLGAVSRIAANVPEKVEDYVSFTGSSSSPLRYPPTGSVKITQQKFFRSEPTAAYDADANSIVLSEEAHGIVKVEYTAYFDRYRVRHAGDQCRIVVVDGDDRDDSYDPAFLVAEAAEYEMVSLEVAGPSCSGLEPGAFVANVPLSDYSQTGLLLEVDAVLNVGIHPYYFRGDRHPQGFTLQPQPFTVDGKTAIWYCGCRVRVYPKTFVEFLGVNCAVSARPVATGVKPILQSLVFSGQQSANLEYPPKGQVSLSMNASSVLTNFGTFASAELAGPGRTVYEVEWLSSNSYNSRGPRKVRADEVCVVTSLGDNTLPCYTFGAARYMAEYNSFDVLFNWDADINWYGPAMVMATDRNGVTGSLQLNPPPRAGIL